jgi:hypothetical protein
MARSARKELLDNIRQYPDKEKIFYKKINAVQRRVRCKRMEIDV